MFADILKLAQGYNMPTELEVQLITIKMINMNDKHKLAHNQFINLNLDTP